jgi:hypothetical protein
MTRVARILTSFGIIFLVLLISIIILLFFLPAQSSSIVFVNPNSCKIGCICGGCAFGNIPQLSDVRIQDIGIAYKWPDQINLNSSDTISVKIATNGAIGIPTSTATATGNYRIAGATPEEVGTPGEIFTNNNKVITTSVADAFGPKYKAFATVQLLATTFDVKTFDLTEQPLDQVWDSWLWNIKPTSLGSQFVGLALDLLWKPINGGQEIRHQVWQTQLPITVTQPFLDKGQLSAGALITGALASGGLITGIITQFVAAGLEQFGKKRDKDKGEVAQQKSETENKIGENQQEGEVAQQKSETENKIGENQQERNEAKRSVQLQRRSHDLSLGVRTHLQRRSRVLTVGVRALLIMLILLLLAGSGLLYYTKILHPAQLSAQATATVAHATATAKANVKATVTSLQQYLIASTSGSTALNDPLVDNSHGNKWTEDSYCTFTRGSYHATIAKKGFIAYCTEELATFTNLAYQVQLSIKSGDEGCLILRLSMSGKTASFDAFCISGNGHYRFTTTSSGDFGSGFTTAAIKGANAINIVTFIVQKRRYDMYINNQYVTGYIGFLTVEGAGAIGVGAIDDVNATDVAFSNAKVWTLR